MILLKMVKQASLPSTPNRPCPPRWTVGQRGSKSLDSSPQVKLPQSTAPVARKYAAAAAKPMLLTVAQDPMGDISQEQFTGLQEYIQRIYLNTTDAPPLRVERTFWKNGRGHFVTADKPTIEWLKNQVTRSISPTGAKVRIYMPGEIDPRTRIWTFVPPWLCEPKDMLSLLKKSNPGFPVHGMQQLYATRTRENSRTFGFAVDSSVMEALTKLDGEVYAGLYKVRFRHGGRRQAGPAEQSTRTAPEPNIQQAGPARQISNAGIASQSNRAGPVNEPSPAKKGVPPPPSPSRKRPLPTGPRAIAEANSPSRDGFQVARSRRRRGWRKPSLAEEVRAKLLDLVPTVPETVAAVIQQLVTNPETAISPRASDASVEQGREYVEEMDISDSTLLDIDT